MGREGKLGYVRALDGVRGIAILSVILFHFYLVPAGGFFGVDLFFVLSGFLITTLLLEEHAEHGSISLSRFYTRRARRLVPALVAVLAFVTGLAAIPGACPFELKRTAIEAALALGYVLNLFIVARDVIPATDPLNHLWSLAEEEQFYLLWPPLLLALLTFGRRRLAVVALVLLVIGAQVDLVEVARSGDFMRVYFAPDTHLVPLVGGCLLAFAKRRLPGASLMAWIALLGFTVLVLHTLCTLHNFVWADPVVPAASAAIIYGATAGGSLARALAVRPLAALGRISYSLYLWHYVLLVLLRRHPTASLALSLPAAYASYRWIERPFRTRRSTERARLARAVPASA